MKFRPLFALATLMSAHAAPAASEPAAVGAGFDVERYAVALTPNLAEKSVTGTEVITVRSLRDGLGSLVFSPNGLTIDGATVNGRAAQVKSDASGIAITLPAPLARGRSATVALRFHGVPGAGSRRLPARWSRAISLATG
jgi:aminopeptidase N